MQKHLWGLIGGCLLTLGSWQLGAGESPTGVAAKVEGVKLAEPEMTVETVDLAGLNMATNDAIQGKPFTLEPDFVGNWQGRVVWPGLGLNTYLTDARGPDADTAEYIVGDGPPEVAFRWELGSPSAGRELNEIRLWWSLSDAQRNGPYVKFTVHDVASKEWKEITPYYRINCEAAQLNHYKVLKLRFPAGAVANFDAIRMISGETLIKGYHPWLLELDVLTGPATVQAESDRQTERRRTAMNVRQTPAIGSAIAAGLGGNAGAVQKKPGKAALTLTRDGQPAAVIILAEKPTQATQFAAFELQSHIKGISGATLPILRETGGSLPIPAGHVKVYLGDTTRAQAAGLTQAKFRQQESGCQFGADEIILAGKDDANYGEVRFDPEKLGDGQANQNWPGFWEERGTMDAVYDLLHDACGVRWLSVTETGTALPQQKTLSVQPHNARSRLSFVYRDLMVVTGDDCSQGIGTALLGASSIWGSWPSGEKAEGHQAWEALAYKTLHQQYTNEAAYLPAKRNFVKLFLLRQKNGGEVNRCNHSMYEYFARFGKNGREGSRPEFFAKGYEGDEPPQLCYTNPELVKQQAKDAAEYYDHNITHIGWMPRLPNYFPIEPMDNGSFCKCPECQRLLALGKKHGAVEAFSKGTDSDYVFNFVNAVQRELAKTHPDKHVITLAYASHAWLPKSIKLDPRVAVEFCFANNGYPANRMEYENDWRLVKKWGEEKKVSGRRLYVWLYPGMNRAGSVSGNYYCFPDYKVHTMAKQMKTLKRYGYEGMFYCGNYLEADAYASYRLMANTDLNVDALQDEYFTGLYGAAAAPLKKLHQAIEAVYCNPALYPKEKGVPGSEVAWRYLGTAKRMAEYEKLVQKAAKLVVTDREKRNLELFKLDIWKYMTQGRAKFLQRQSAPIQSAKAAVVPVAEGDPAKVEWAKASELPAGWYSVGGNTPISRKLTGKLAHDGKYLYVELVDPCDPRKLAISPHVAPYDDWELFAAKQRGLPGRQFMVGPSDLVSALMHGEINWRMFDRLKEHGLRVASDTTAPDKWVLRFSVPLANVVPGGAKPGEKIYVNFIRVASGAVSPGQMIIPWVSYTTVHEWDRLAEVILEKP